MDISSLSVRLPAYAAMLQIPWFILLSIARVRMGGTGALPLVKMIDLLVPLPAFAGLLLALLMLWKLGGSGDIWLWGGALACASISLVFLTIMMR